MEQKKVPQPIKQSTKKWNLRNLQFFIGQKHIKNEACKPYKIIAVFNKLTTF